MTLDDKSRKMLDELIDHTMKTNNIEPAVDDEGCTLIPVDKVEELVDFTTFIICEINQFFINAGSEREVTIENEELNIALTNEFSGWVKE